MNDWYPGATKSLGNESGSFVAGYAKKGVLHTTEGSSAAGAVGAYKKNNSWPHFTVGQDGAVLQHVPISRASRSLENQSGGIETNRGGAIQIEVVGFASKTVWPAVQVEAMQKLMRWIEKEAGISPVGPSFGANEQYGLKNPFEFKPDYWIKYNGWCGHQHVPENSHWDPGAINISTLFPAPLPPPPPSFTVPASYHTEVANVPFTVPRSQGGYIVVGGDGGVFTYDTPFYGSLGGVALGSPVVAAAWTPSGAGYWLLGADGAVFAFGDAPYKGALNTTDVDGNRKPIGIVAKGNGYRIVTLDPSGDGSPFDPYEFGV